MTIVSEYVVPYHVLAHPSLFPSPPKKKEKRRITDILSASVRMFSVMGVLDPTDSLRTFSLAAKLVLQGAEFFNDKVCNGFLCSSHSLSPVLSRP